jgi:hypothetical protein
MMAGLPPTLTNTGRFVLALMLSLRFVTYAHAQSEVPELVNHYRRKWAQCKKKCLAIHIFKFDPVQLSYIKANA